MAALVELDPANKLELDIVARSKPPVTCAVSLCRRVAKINTGGA